METVRDAMFDQMRQLGLTTLFGNPGSTEETFLARFPDDVDYVLGLQEASVVAMADGYAQATGHPALVNLHTGAGTGNAMTSILTAYQNRSPLIITAGNQTRAMLLSEPWLTNVEPTALPKPWVKWAYQPDRPSDAPAALQRAYLTASQPPAGPVYLSFPLDDWNEPAGEPVPPRTVTERFGPEPSRIAHLADALRAAARSALVVGAGVDRADAWNETIVLAEGLGADVFAPAASERVAFPESHPQHRGTLPFAIGPLSDRLRGYDVVVVIGAPVFRYYPYIPGDYLPAGTTLFQVTDDPGEAARAVAGHSILADAGLAVSALVETLDLSDGVPTTPDTTTAPLPSMGLPLTAEALFAVLDDERRPGTVLVEESPSNLAVLRRRWKVNEPRSFFTFASGALGWGLPASVGLALGERATGRNRPVLAIVGDGSAHYSIQSLWTAACRELPLVVVVPDNHEYAILKAFAVVEKTPAVPGLDLPGIDITRIAEGYGCRAVRAESERDLRDALRDARGNHGPTVITVPIDTTVPPLV